MRRRMIISAFLTVAVGLAGWIAADARFRLFSETQMSPKASSDARTRKSVGSIGSSEDMVEIDFTAGVITGTSDQYAIGRAAR